MATPALFSIVKINGREYRLQDVQPQADGSAVWMLSRAGFGSVYSVNVAADGTIGVPRFLY